MDIGRVYQCFFHIWLHMGIKREVCWRISSVLNYFLESGSFPDHLSYEGGGLSLLFIGDSKLLLNSILASVKVLNLFAELGKGLTSCGITKLKNRNLVRSFICAYISHLDNAFSTQICLMSIVKQ